MMNILKGIKRKIKIIEYKNIDDILKTEKVSESNKHKTIVWAIYKKNIDLKSVEVYLRNFQNKNQTDYRRLLCLYDILKFATDDDFDTYQFFSIN
jgi:uncharacterized membrane protein YjjP (DUF1212 family)